MFLKQHATELDDVTCLHVKIMKTGLHFEFDIM